MIHTFTVETVPSIQDVGGKARSLIEATHSGFNVPDGFVLDVEYFQPWLDNVTKSDAWAGFLATSEADIKRHCDGVKDFCASLALDAPQVQALKAAIEDWPEDVVVAVRSSSPEEDLEGSSFAGGYETTLGVTRETLQAAILHSFTSVFDERIVTYKMQHGMATDDPRIAVVVQLQIASEVSGVAFSLNPQNNCFDEAVINANFGLGETVVAGVVTPDTYVVDKVELELIDKNIANKSHGLHIENGGGTRERANERPDASCLTDAQAIEIAQLAARAEDHYGKPMDIEWAIEDGTLHLLQSRPITTYVPLPDSMVTAPGAQKNLYLDVIVLSQGFAESLSVLGLDIWGRMLEAVKSAQGMVDRGSQGTILNVDGRQYFHVSNLFKALGGGVVSRVLTQYDTPTRKIFESIDLKNEYLPKETPRPLKGLRWRAFKSIGSVVPAAYRGFRNSDRAVKAFEEQFAELVVTCKALVARDMPIDELVDRLLAVFQKQISTVIGVLAPSLVARWRIGRMFRNDDVHDLVVALEMDLRGNPTSEMGHAMYQLASRPEIQATHTGDEFEQKVHGGAYSAELSAQLDAYFDRFGCRGIKEIDIATPRVYENLPAFFDQLHAIDIDTDTINTAKSRRAAAYEKLRALAQKKGKAVKFERLARQQVNGGYREAPKYFFIVVVDLVRRRALELGKTFVAQGRLARADQIFDLTRAQIAAGQRDPSLDLADLAANNLAPRGKFARVRHWPRFIDSRGKIFRAKAVQTEDANVLVGDPIAPGVVRGKAKVLDEPYAKPLEKGEILVTRASDPGWTPIFINAAGVVLEVGGPLQHGAIIAREYGLPCVSGIDRVTDVVVDGQLLEVDGTNGVVRVLSDESVEAA